MKKKIIIAICALFIATSAYFGFACYALSDSNIEELVVACLHPETNYYPPGLAEYYMLNFRGNAEDIDLLKSGVGLGFVLSLDENPRDKVFNYATFFIEKGLDVNTIGMDGTTPLHSAVILNHSEDVAFLIEKGADPTIPVGNSRLYGKDEKLATTGLTPSELAAHMSDKDGKDRSKILSLLDTNK